MIVTTKYFGGLTRHIERRGHPACGAPRVGALLVEDAAKSTCPDCALVVSIAILGVQLIDRRS